MGGVAQFDVHVDEDIKVESMDTDDILSGWYEIGNYNIEDPEVEVWISNPSTRGVVFADAIRWSLAESN